MHQQTNAELASIPGRFTHRKEKQKLTRTNPQSSNYSHCVNKKQEVFTVHVMSLLIVFVKGYTALKDESSMTSTVLL